MPSSYVLVADDWDAAVVVMVGMWYVVGVLEVVVAAGSTPLATKYAGRNSTVDTASPDAVGLVLVGALVVVLIARVVGFTGTGLAVELELAGRGVLAGLLEEAVLDAVDDASEALVSLLVAVDVVVLVLLLDDVATGLGVS